MRTPLIRLRLNLALAAAAMFALAAAASAQTGYGVTSAGTLFRFDVNNSGTTTTIGGTLPFVPEGIDFRPGTRTLYALDVGPETTQLYTIDIVTGVATPVGGGFPSQVTGEPSGNYSLLGATIGFDFNPRTLQADGSVRIRVVASNRANLRLDSDTGDVSAVDTPLDYPDADPSAAATPQVDAAAYINSARSTDAGGGTSTLYVIDFGTDDLATQNPQSTGQLNTIGPLGGVVNADSGVGFDIITDPTSVDDGIGGDRAYAVLRRPDAPTGSEGAYRLYDVNLSTGQITGGRAVGPEPGTNFAGGFAVLGDLVAEGGLIISEFRFRGPEPDASPTSSQNEFIELYNASGSDIIVSAADGSEGYSVAASVPALPPAGGARVSALAASTRLFVIPNGTRIPARGHYLAVHSLGFSLRGYPADAGGVGPGDDTYTFDVDDGEGIAIFNTANTANYSEATRLDAVGFEAESPGAKADGGGADASPRVSDPLFFEGTPISTPVFSPNEHSWVRRLDNGPPTDTDDNEADFVLVSTDPGFFEGFLPAILGAPGPESSQSPIQRNDFFKAAYIDPGCITTTDLTLACGRTRDTTPDAANNSDAGTMRIRRRWTNNTGQPVTRIRFRVVDITTFGSPNGCGGCTQSDLRVRSSAGESGLTLSFGGTADTQGLTLETPPDQPEGGGLNSSLSVELANPLDDGDSINVNFLLGVKTAGFFRFFVNIEALRQTETPLPAAAPARGGASSLKAARAKQGGASRRRM